MHKGVIIAVLQSLSRVRHFETPWTGACHASQSSTHSSEVCSNSSSLSQWCHPTTQSSVTPFSSCLQSFPASGSFPISRLFASGGQSIGASASASVLSMSIQDRFPLGWTGWISLQPKGLSSLLQYHNSKASILQPSAFFRVQLTSIRLLEKP